MKKKYRIAIYYAIVVLAVIITLPIWILGLVTAWITEKLAEGSDILKYLLRIYSEDKTDNQ